jgi:hypothetical protein
VPGTYQEFREAIATSRSIATTTRALRQVDEQQSEGSLVADQACWLRLDAFQALRRQTVRQPDVAVSMIGRELLPFCIEPLADGEYLASRYRSSLGDWLASATGQVRDQVVNSILERLEAPNPEAACWTLSAIGLRTPGVLAALRSVFERLDDVSGDAALSALTWIRPRPEDRPLLVREVNMRLRRRMNLPLFMAMDRLADPVSITTLRAALIKTIEHEGEGGFTSLVLQCLTSIADEHDNDEALQARIWGLIHEHILRFRTRLAPMVYLGGHIAPRCDTPFVIRDLVALLPAPDTTEELQSYHRYLLCLRLLEAVRPRQIEGWYRAGKSFTALMPTVALDTKMPGRGTTSEAHAKESGLDVLLRSGRVLPRRLIDTLLFQESNPYVSHSLALRLACFCSPAPSARLLGFVTERFDGDPDLDGEWARRLGAVAVAKSSASPSAFEALLNCGFTLRGQVLTDTADALAQVADWLLERGWERALPRLFDVAQTGANINRQAAAGALHYLAANQRLHPSDSPRLIALLGEDELSEFDRSNLVAALGYIPSRLPPEIVQTMTKWAAENDGWLGWRSLEALARLDYRDALRALYEVRLGLTANGKVWTGSQSRDGIGWATYIVGLLYQKHPKVYASALASIIEKGNWGAAAQAIRALLPVDRGTAKRPSRSVRQSLAKRLATSQTPYHAETELFAVLSQIAPDILVRPRLRHMWDRWLPQARIALADALGTAVFPDPSLSARALQTLIELSGDSHFGVRRSSFRAIALLSPIGLRIMCEAWAGTETENQGEIQHDVDTRLRAAEGCCWLPRILDGDQAFNLLNTRLSLDPERSVRVAADRARTERRERNWAKGYLEVVLGVENGSAAEMRQAWRCGEALVQVGDDEALRAVSLRLESAQLAPCVRHWLLRLSKELSDRWEKVTREWPEPVATWRGNVDEGEGILTIPSGRSFSVHYTIWESPSASPDEKSDWGGVAIADDDVWTLTVLGDSGTLTIHGEKSGRIILRNTSGTTLSFLGTGPAPS